MTPAKGIAGVFQLCFGLQLWYTKGMEPIVFRRTPKERLDDGLAKLYKLAESPSLNLHDRMELMTIAFLVTSVNSEAFTPEPEASDTVAMASRHEPPAHYSRPLVGVAKLLYTLADNPAFGPAIRNDLRMAGEMVDSENHRLSTALKQARQTAGGTQRKIQELGQTIRDLENHLENLEHEGRS